MSLLSLRKSTPQAEPSQVSIDSFIDEALNYANGLTPEFTGSAECVPGGNLALAANEHMRKATFTLDQATIRTLARLSAQTDISRSRLIRIWADEQSRRDESNLLCATTV